MDTATLNHNVWLFISMSNQICFVLLSVGQDAIVVLLMEIHI